VKHQRDPVTNLAPESLKKIHPLGKAPVLVDGRTVVVESGAIVEYVVRRHGQGRLAPAETSPDWPHYVQLMHYAEGSAMLPLMLKLYLGRLGDAGAPLQPRVTSEIENHFGWLEAGLGDADWFVGGKLSAADIQLSFAIQALRMLHGLEKFTNLARFLERLKARPAYQRALERGGPYAFD
jgi:glutathione S-transferase